MPRITTVADYLANTPPTGRKALTQLRTTIRAAAPGITERIGDRIPTLELDGHSLLYLAAVKVEHAKARQTR